MVLSFRVAQVTYCLYMLHIVYIEDTSSIPVPETKFKGSEGERLGRIVVTPEVVFSKINNMKENKSPGVDGISPKLLKETVEQISTPLAHVFNMSPCTF